MVQACWVLRSLWRVWRHPPAVNVIDWFGNGSSLRAPMRFLIRATVDFGNGRRSFSTDGFKAVCKDHVAILSTCTRLEGAITWKKAGEKDISAPLKISPLKGVWRSQPLEFIHLRFLVRNTRVAWPVAPFQGWPFSNRFPGALPRADECRPLGVYASREWFGVQHRMPRWHLILSSSQDAVLDRADNPVCRVRPFQVEHPTLQKVQRR
jgi:hypothetical protein